MAEEQQPVEKQFSIQKIYTKDMSFETPNSPKIFTEKWEPSVDFNLASHVETLENSLYEVALTVTITVKSNDKTAYLVEVNQAGIFALSGFSDQEMGLWLAASARTFFFLTPGKQFLIWLQKAAFRSCY